MHSFIMSALRKARWGQKYQAIRNAYFDDGINPKTGRSVKLHRCAICDDCFMANEMHADHLSPVVPLTGFDSWDGVIERMFCEADGFQALCIPCHKELTKEENEERRRLKQ